MPWKECSVMDERLKFVARRLAGEPIAELCREFGISRKTGYKIFDRYQECGIHGLTPANIRSDNGVPFASAQALFNLSKLAVWWLRLGIGIERIQPGHPQQNGRQERMHL